MKFIDQLNDVTHATKKQIDEEHWHVEGFLKTRTNQRFKFDISPLIKFKENDYACSCINYFWFFYFQFITK